MDSVTQLALGAVVAQAVVGGTARPGRYRALAWGAFLGTLPDLDILLAPVLNDMQSLAVHRGYSHAWPVQLLAAPLIAWLPWRLQNSNAKAQDTGPSYQRWCLAVSLVLTSHALIDLFTIYGTQIWLPFTDTPYSLDSFFIIDPLFSLPLLLAMGIALVRPRAVLPARLALLICSLEAVWALSAQAVVAGRAEAMLAERGVRAERFFATPTPFNTLAWRIVAVEGDSWHEGFYSLLVPSAGLRHFRSWPRNTGLLVHLNERSSLDRLLWFNRGFFQLQKSDGRLLLQDLRFGEGQQLLFAWQLAERDEGGWVGTVPARRVDTTLNTRRYGERLLDYILPAQQD